MTQLATTARIEIHELREIFVTDLDVKSLIQFVNSASTIVTEDLSASGLSAARLRLIELYLSAHLASLADPRKESEDYAGEYKYKSQGKTGLNLDATFYGQTVKMLDSSGTLSELAQGLRPASLIILSDVT